MALPLPPDVAQFQDAFQSRLARQADASFAEGDYPTSVSILTLRAETSPEDYEAWTDLGWMMENVGEYPRAEKLYVRYASAAAGETDRLLPMAEFLARRRRFADVVVWLGPGIKDRKAHPNHWRLLGRAYEKTGRTDDAIRVWRDYLKDHKDLAAEANIRRVEAKLGKV